MKLRKKQLPSPRARLIDLYIVSSFLILATKTALPDWYSAAWVFLRRADNLVSLRSCHWKFAMSKVKTQSVVSCALTEIWQRVVAYDGTTSSWSELASCSWLFWRILSYIVGNKEGRCRRHIPCSKASMGSKSPTKGSRSASCLH